MTTMFTMSNSYMLVVNMHFLYTVFQPQESEIKPHYRLHNNNSCSVFVWFFPPCFLSCSYFKTTLPLGVQKPPPPPPAINICVLTLRRCGWAWHASDSVHKSNPNVQAESRHSFHSKTSLALAARGLIKKYDAIITWNKRSYHFLTGENQPEVLM